MIAIGAVVLGREGDKNHGFHSTLCPISPDYVQGALDVCGFTREDTMNFTYAVEAINKFSQWLEKESNNERLVFVSDNPAFDWQFVNYYFHKYQGANPFGHSARRIGDFAAGLARDWPRQSKWKQLRKTKHTHNPLDDARGNAEALSELLRNAEPIRDKIKRGSL